jgi:hypothetical protein
MALPMTLDHLEAIALRLPGVEASQSRGTHSFTVRKKLFLRLKEDGTALVRTDPYERGHLLESSPEAFFIDDRIRDHPWVRVRVGRADAGQLRALVEDAWRRTAPRRLLEAFDG